VWICGPSIGRSVLRDEPGRQRDANQSTDGRGQTAGAKTYPDIVRGEGPNPTEFTLMAVYNNGTFAMAVDHTSFKIRLNAQGQPDFEHVSPFNKN